MNEKIDNSIGDEINGLINAQIACNMMRNRCTALNLSCDEI